MTDSLEQAIASLEHWERRGDSIFRSLRFSSFLQAIEFMHRAAAFCEEIDHHPDWSNCYKTLDISLTTHDAGGITEKDIWLAGKLDGLSREMAEG